MSLKYGAVPVVVGAPKADYTKVAPPNSFIHVGDFDTFTDLANYLKRVDKDDRMYRKYHEWRNHGEVHGNNLSREARYTMCRTIPHIYPRRAGEYKYVADSPWYNGCREAPSNRTLVHIFETMEDWTVWRWII